MRYNKHELAALASQTTQNFEREGVLVLKEKQDGFFRRSDGMYQDCYVYKPYSIEIAFDFR